MRKNYIMHRLVSFNRGTHESVADPKNAGIFHTFWPLLHNRIRCCTEILTIVLKKSVPAKSTFYTS